MSCTNPNCSTTESCECGKHYGYPIGWYAQFTKFELIHDLKEKSIKLGCSFTKELPEIIKNKLLESVKEHESDVIELLEKKVAKAAKLGITKKD